jgi:hypothetical protein
LRYRDRPLVQPIGSLLEVSLSEMSRDVADAVLVVVEINLSRSLIGTPCITERDERRTSL